jgi:hypothetical protein
MQIPDWARLVTRRRSATSNRRGISPELAEQAFGRNEQSNDGEAESHCGSDECISKTQNEMTKIVENYGCLYRLTNVNYRRLLTFVAAGKEYDLCELGAHIGCVHVSMVNFGKDDAEFELSRLQNEPGSRSRSGHASRR